ncbi:MAG TPA: ABC transporter permease [Gemmatimonadales bacterium]|nr:ABC transporter permease [Gemmatimonadales bacterium]
MDSLLFDVRYAFRRLRQAPLFSLVVILTLALGIGANSAIFSVINTVLLEPLPYRDPGQLVTIYHYYPSLKMEAPVSAPGFKDYRDRTHSFANVAVESQWSANLTGMGDPERLAGAKVSGAYFQTVGVAPAMGRVFTVADDQAGHDHQVVLSYGAWLRLFGGSRDAVGRQMVLNGEQYQVIGVMPRSFVDFWANQTDVWVPIALDPALFVPGNYTNESMPLIARLKPGVTVDAAAREMKAFAEQLKRDNPTNFSPDWTLEVKALTDVQTGPIRPALLVLLGAVGFVLLIACANVANLLLARAAARQREVAIRTALGARARDLIAQLLAESLILAVIGGALGLALAWIGVRALVAANPTNLPRVADLAIDGHVVLFTAGVAVLTGLLFGLVPALQVRRNNLHATLKEGARNGTADRAGQLVRKVLVVAEIALALTLLTGGGLLIRSFARLSGVDPGFDPHHLLTFNLALPTARYPSATTRNAFWTAVMPRLAQVPGVQSVGGTTVLPFGGGWSTGSFNVEGYTPPPKGNSPWGDIRLVTPDFLRTLRVPLVHGRLLASTDDEHAPLRAVVDEEFVHRYYPAGTDPIGKRLWFGGPSPDSTTQWITIVGVVGHTKHEGLDADPRIQLYLPVTQNIPNDIGGLGIAVRAAGDPLRLVPALRNAIHEVDRDLPIARVRTMDDMLSASMGQRRLSMVLLVLFAAIALLLASLGIYGVMSFAVAQRTRELGVRVALGASRENVLGLVLRQGMALAAIGAVLGIAGALGLTRLMTAQLYGIHPDDPATFATVTAVLLLVAVAATLIPALRATRVDPIIALREE